MRVVSLLPSATEIAYALGVEPVGVSHSCDHPPAAAGTPTLTRSLVDHEASAAEIDAQVRAIDGTTYALHTELLAELAPDVILTQGTCEVCAVEATAVHEAVAAHGLDCEVVSLDPHTLDEVLDDVRRVGRAVGRTERADRVVGRLRDRVARATHPAWAKASGAGRRTNGDENATTSENRTASEDTHEDATTSGRNVGTDPSDEQGPRTLVFDWTEPPILAGHWIPGMVERAGGRTARPTDDRTAPSAPVEWSWVREYDPEVIVAAPCGFDRDRAADAVADLRARVGWNDLAAVERDAVYVADGSGLFNRPGPRLVDTLEALRAVCDPERSVRAADGVDRFTRVPVSAD